MPQIIGVQFQRAGKIYYFDSADQQIESDTYVIVALNMRALPLPPTGFRKKTSKCL